MMRRQSIGFRCGQLVILVGGLLSSVVAQGLRHPDVANLEIALRKLNVLGTALYVGAHPDDENSAVIAALGEGRLVRTAYLSMTRGEGGQNLIGAEQGTLLGVIRTQELLGARRIDGGRQFFTRAIDFGYSKTSEETIRIWGREKIVGDIVWIIRSFRPDVIITRFLDTLGGHGNHLASAILAREAFEAAGDPKKFPEQLKYVQPWKPIRIVFNTFRFGGSGMDPTARSVRLDAGEYNPILGESYTEISGMSRSMHKSQGTGSGQFRGENLQYFEPTEGQPATKDLFDGINMTWTRVKGGEKVGALLRKAQDEFRPERPSTIVPALLQALNELNNLGPDPWVDQKRKDLIDVILACCGIWTDATSATYEASPGALLPITVSTVNRSDESVSLVSIRAPFMADSLVRVSLKNNTPLNVKTTVTIPRGAKPSQPYWLEHQPTQGGYVIDDQQLVGLPENPPALSVGMTFRIAGEPLQIEIPVRYRWVDPVDGESYRPFVVVPPVAVNLANPTYVFPNSHDAEVRVMIRGTGTSRTGVVHLDLPEHWVASPQSIPFEVKNGNDEITMTFRIKPMDGAKDGSFRAIAETGGESVDRGMTVIKYPHFPIQTLFPESEGKLVRVDLHTGTTRRVGYIVGPGDEIPDALRQIGYDVTPLSDADLTSGDLSLYQTVVAGVRAYNTRPALIAHQDRLMAYVQNGGRYIVQYMTPSREETASMGPFPFSISRDRVTVEGAPVHFLKPGHPLLNVPNRITTDDFKGWVQERGLYFASKWDPKYETVMECSDPGEAALPGGLLYAHYGKGIFIFTAYAFFRQLPAGVPGAFRLFSNMLAAQ